MGNTFLTATAGAPLDDDHYLGDDSFGDDNSSEGEVGSEIDIDYDGQVEAIEASFVGSQRSWNLTDTE